MAEEPDPERLRALHARLSEVKAAAAKPAGRGKDFSQGEIAWRMVIELVSGMVIGLSIGYGIDYLFDTRPVFLVIFVLFGFAAGIRTVIGTAREAAEKQAKAAGADPAQRPGQGPEA